MDVCRRFLFSGKVQGVGFRYTAKELAEKYPVCGYVRNLPDGRVELVVQGRQEDVDGLVTDIRRYMGRYIREVDVAEVDRIDCDRFEIRL